MLSALPSLLIARMENDEPKCTASKTLKLPPPRIPLRMLQLDPSVQKSSIDIAEPARAVERMEHALPMETKSRTEKLLSTRAVGAQTQRGAELYGVEDGKHRFTRLSTRETLAEARE
jgi:hypothetical protein